MASMRPVMTQPAVGSVVSRSSEIGVSETPTSVISEPKPSTASPITPSSRHW